MRVRSGHSRTGESKDQHGDTDVQYCMPNTQVSVVCLYLCNSLPGPEETEPFVFWTQEPMCAMTPSGVGRTVISTKRARMS